MKRSLLLILLMSAFFFQACTVEEGDNTGALAGVFALRDVTTTVCDDPGEYRAKMYYIDPAYILDMSNLTNYVTEASSSNVTAGKKKLVFIHGGNFADRDTADCPTDSELILDKVTDSGSWGEVLITSEILSLIALEYDFYFFTYLSSNAVDTNGARLRAKMDALFAADTETVVIYAHSMGGYVSRFAMYESARPTYMKKVYTAGTPYHGLPIASPEYGSLPDGFSLLGLVDYLSVTDAGQNLRWDNFDNSLPGATNTELEALNAKTDRNDLFHAYYGECDHTATIPCSGDTASQTYAAGCLLLSNAYTPSDCVVPATSSNFDSAASAITSTSLGSYAHDDIKLQKNTIRQLFLNDITSLP